MLSAGLFPFRAPEGLFAGAAFDEVTTRPFAVPASVGLFNTASENGKASGTSANSFKVTEHILVNEENSYASAAREASVKVTPETIENTAGTFGDPSRYFQMLPGVVSDNDQRNDMLVRGGNPLENLFVIDGIVVPSINHLALSDTTGGFVSMIDNDAIESITLYSGLHDARYPDRLSSVIDISTLPDHARKARRVFEAGLSGIGGIVSTPLADKGNFLFSARQSVLNMITDDIGLNGVPKYTNSLIRGDHSYGERDRVWGMSLTGVDSIAIRPAFDDPFETNIFNIDYSGWRNTTGLNWQHVFSSGSFGVLTVSNAEQQQNIRDEDQLLSNAITYDEHSHDGTSTAMYNVTSQVKPWLLASGGVTTSVTRVHYDIAQPVPLENPYSPTIDPSSVTNILQRFQTPNEGAFGQATFSLPHHAVFTVSGRADHWNFGDHTSLTPRALLNVPILSHRVGFGFAEYTQMPPFLYLVAFAANRSLAPIKTEHTTVDVDVIRRPGASLTLSAYRKLYFRYPVPIGFPELSMANVADTFGESYLLFPLTSGGGGRTEGVEMNLQAKPAPRLQLSASATYARAWYSGLDGVLRRGNYDIPLIVNTSALLRLGRGFSISTRYSAASGRPYTPDILAESIQQDRDVANLSEINLGRSQYYGRLDLRVEQKLRLPHGALTWNVGLLNVLDRANFYEYIWAPRVPYLLENPSLSGLTEQDQLPRFPEGSFKYVF